MGRGSFHWDPNLFILHGPCAVNTRESCLQSYVCFLRCFGGICSSAIYPGTINKLWSSSYVGDKRFVLSSGRMLSCTPPTPETQSPPRRAVSRAGRFKHTPLYLPCASIIASRTDQSHRNRYPVEVFSLQLPPEHVVRNEYLARSPATAHVRWCYPFVHLEFCVTSIVISRACGSRGTGLLRSGYLLQKKWRRFMR